MICEAFAMLTSRARVEERKQAGWRVVLLSRQRKGSGLKVADSRRSIVG